MDNVKLMNRTDIKFCFHSTQLNEIVKLLEKDYRILQINNKRISRYETLYYDTADHKLYQWHQCGKLNRFKIRHRTYVESNLGFLEIKYKTNRGRTIKHRIVNREIPLTIEKNHYPFLNKASSIDPGTLIPAVWINYNRITLVSKLGPERLTFDFDLTFNRNNQSLGLNELVIAEIKQEGKLSSPFFAVMKNYKIKEGSISKYAMSIAMTSNLKKNNFKQKIKTILKITNDSHHTFTNH
jgi:hypothetical protein